MKTKIYGASDDLVEIEGAISDEHGCYDHKRPISVIASDGTKATIFYGDKGEWEVEVKEAGTKYITIIRSVGEDAVHIGEEAGCTSYSDILVLDEGIEWVKIGRKTYKS